MSTSWYMHVLNLVCTTLYYLQYDLQNMTHNVYVLVYSVMQLYENMQEWTTYTCIKYVPTLWYFVMATSC